MNGLRCIVFSKVLFSSVRPSCGQPSAMSIMSGYNVNMHLGNRELNQASGVSKAHYACEKSSIPELALGKLVL